MELGKIGDSKRLLVQQKAKIKVTFLKQSVLQMFNSWPKFRYADCFHGFVQFFQTNAGILP
jgi:hypothetical protein